MIVSLLGIASLITVRIQRRQMAVSTDRRAARMNANSAVELALRVITNNANWRTTYSNGVETAPQSLGANGSGTVSWILVDTDGSLTDADTNLRLAGVGRVGNTVQVSSVKLATLTSNNAEQTWLDENKPGDGSNFVLDTGNGIGTNFTPTLPPDAISWSVTRVEVWCTSFQSGDLDAQVTTQDSWGNPAAAIDTVTVSSADLPNKFDWHEVIFPNATGLSPSEGACVVFKHQSGGRCARIKRGYESTASPGTSLKTTTNGGLSWTSHSDQDLWVRIYGSYSTATGIQPVTGTWTWAAAP